MTIHNITIPRDRLADLCRRFGVEELSIFGSALREDFRPPSDVDFLVVFKNNDYGPWLSKLTGLEGALAKLLGRNVDLVPKEGLKWVIRDRVLQSAQVVYEDR